MQKRTFVSGYPWWFVTAFFILCAFFGFISIAVFSQGALLTVGAMIMFALIYRLSAPQVYLGDDCLYISRIGRTAMIPLDHVACFDEAKASWPFRPYSAIIHFTTDTPFGRSLYLGSFGSVPSMTLQGGSKSSGERLRKQQRNDLTRRSSQPLAVPMFSFQVTLLRKLQFTLALASGG